MCMSFTAPPEEVGMGKEEGMREKWRENAWTGEKDVIEKEGTWKKRREGKAKNSLKKINRTKLSITIHGEKLRF